MIARYKNKTNVGILIGLALQFSPLLLLPALQKGGTVTPALVGATLLARLAGVGFIVYGCWNYALGKGYNGAWGLLGLLSCLGLLILVCFPDQRKDGTDPDVRGFEVLPGSPRPVEPTYPPRDRA